MIEVRVPATSANIGPGFDCLGIALNLYNIYRIEEIESGLVIEGCEEKYANAENLIYVAMEKCFEQVGYKPRGIKIVIDADIPVSRGLVFVFASSEKLTLNWLPKNLDLFFQK